MLKKLKTKYSDFLNEDIYLKHELRSMLMEMSRTNLVASLLCMMQDAPGLYDDDSQINYISLSDTINMLSYIAPNRRDYSKDMFSADIPKTEMRIGRLVRKIISDIDKSKLKFKYSGKSIITLEHPIFNVRSDKELTTLLFVASKTGEEFSKEWQSSGFVIGFEDKETVGTEIDLCGTDVKLTVDGKTYNTKVFQFDDQCYHSRWEKELVYFTLQLNDNLNIGQSIRSRRGERYTGKIDGSVEITDIELELTSTFGGKLVEQINDADIEKFVNELMAYIKITRAPEGSAIEVVKGEEIKKWYDGENYQKMIGQLGGSCMAHKECQPYLDIYTENPEVSLLILKNGDKLMGRALLWKLDSGKYFMDRVYCTSDFDERIFVKYAIDHGYYYRNNGGNNNIKFFFDGKSIPKPEDLFVTLSDTTFDYYPYMDTLKDLDLGEDVLSFENDDFNSDRELRDTGGKWSGYEEDDE